MSTQIYTLFTHTTTPRAPRSVSARCVLYTLMSAWGLRSRPLIVRAQRIAYVRGSSRATSPQRPFSCHDMCDFWALSLVPIPSTSSQHAGLPPTHHPGTDRTRPTSCCRCNEETYSLGLLLQNQRRMHPRWSASPPSSSPIRRHHPSRKAPEHRPGLCTSTDLVLRYRSRGLSADRDVPGAAERRCRGWRWKRDIQESRRSGSDKSSGVCRQSQHHDWILCGMRRQTERWIGRWGWFLHVLSWSR